MGNALDREEEINDSTALSVSVTRSDAGDVRREGTMVWDREEKIGRNKRRGLRVY